jgi:triacylglycerol lipase
MRRRGHLWALTCVVTGIAALAACTPSTRPLREISPVSVTSSGHPPVLIVPGWALECRQGPASEWSKWTDALLAAGWLPGEVEVLDYDACAPAKETAARVGAAVDTLLARTGQKKVDLVAHSMGAIPMRWCVRFGSCQGRVDKAVMLSGANHGTFWANACPLQYWSKGCPDLESTSQVLAALNQGDETPDDVAWQTWVSICEVVIVPRSSAALHGADNHDVTNRCVLHDDWKRDVPTIRSVVGWFSQG